MKNWLAAFLATVTVSLAHAGEFDMQGWIDEQVGAGAVLAVTAMHLQDGEVSYFAGGRLAPGGDSAPDEAAQFEIGSLTKAFTNLLLADEMNRAAKLGEDIARGNEIIYVPCHRSHIDYLLLSYLLITLRLGGADIDVDVAIVGGGFTGLSTAYHLKKAEPGLRIAILESEVIGFGASGRNGGFNMTLFGLTLGITALRFGKRKAREAHLYMEKAVDMLRDLVAELDLDCDYEHPGFLRVATSEKYRTRILEEIELAHKLGLDGICSDAPELLLPATTARSGDRP